MFLLLCFDSPPLFILSILETFIRFYNFDRTPRKLDTKEVRFLVSPQNLLRLVTKVLLLLCFYQVAWAKPLFEGYYKVTIGENHIGYLIQRFDLNSQNKTFENTYYMHMVIGGVTSIESLQASCDLNFKPIKYKYTSLDDKKAIAIDAVTRGKRMSVKVIENKKARVRDVRLDDQAFFVSFLNYMMLKHPKGLQIGNKYEYAAVAEEDGGLAKGIAWIKERVSEMGMDTYRILNTYKGDKFVNWVNDKGESIKTYVPKIQLTAELVRSQQEATGSIPFNDKTVRLLFGSIPRGQINQLAKMPRSKAKPATRKAVKNSPNQAPKSPRDKGSDAKNK